MQERLVWSLGQEDPLEQEMQLTPLFLPGEFHGQRSLVVYIQGIAKSRTQPSEHAQVMQPHDWHVSSLEDAWNFASWLNFQYQLS